MPGLAGRQIDEHGAERQELLGVLSMRGRVGSVKDHVERFPGLDEGIDAPGRHRQAEPGRLLEPTSGRVPARDKLKIETI